MVCAGATRLSPQVCLQQRWECVSRVYDGGASARTGRRTGARGGSQTIPERGGLPGGVEREPQPVVGRATAEGRPNVRIYRDEARTLWRKKSPQNTGPWPTGGGSNGMRVDPTSAGYTATCRATHIPHVGLCVGQCPSWRGGLQYRARRQRPQRIPDSAAHVHAAERAGDDDNLRGGGGVGVAALANVHERVDAGGAEGVRRM